MILMGIKEIEREIRESGKNEIDIIIRDAEAEIGKINKQAEQEAHSMAGKLEEKSGRETELERKRILAKANLQIKEMLEKKKDELIEKVFAEARKRVMDMSEKEKAKIIKMLAEEGKKGLESPTVFIDKKYSKLLPGAKPKDIGDIGVLVTSGHISVNNTLTAKLDKLKSDSRHKVAGVLWRS